MTEQRVKDVIKVTVMQLLDLLPPDKRASAFEEIAVQLRSRLARDTHPVFEAVKLP